MTKKEMIAKIAEKAEISQTQAHNAVDAFVEVVGEEMAKGEKLAIAGFGTFEVRERAERQGHNPRTGESMKIPASKSVAFKNAKALKERL